MNADIHTLTGAYVLDALSADEREAFEEHLAQCADCSHEVRELRETTAYLGSAVAAPAPERLKSRVLDQARTTRQLPPDEGPIVPIRGRKWPLRVTSAVAAASVVAALVLGIQVGLTNQELSETRQALEQSEQVYGELADVLTAPDARVATGEDEVGTVTVVFSDSEQKLTVIPNELSDPPDDRVYQVWFLDGGAPTSAGLLTNADRPMVTDTVSEAAQLGITVEPAGGSEAPTTDPVMMISLDT
ncbi:anti-sigma factor [Haloechinothrix sp. YIM 98757]|uniref:Regulator of SigK n=1 Tax=Haloechinothrix aidingensis TaxID=2752311 RepID=A0A838AD30_9PSEU|nr:anti-sigma factor [Haloechinothrix aidingensis]MBA0127121.1 anti-sigma factor [Haloechinothrix aidingensis]